MVRRQANVKGGRSVEHRVMVTPDQELQLKAKADEQAVTIPKLLVDSALGTPQTPPRAALAELTGLRRKLNEVSEILTAEAGLEERNHQLLALFAKYGIAP